MQRISSSSVRVIWPRFSRDELIALLEQRTNELAEHLPLRLAVLFGSWAQGRATAFSDVDLLVVYEGHVRDDAFALVQKGIGLRELEPHVYSADEADRNSEVLERWIRDGVVVFPVMLLN